MNSQSTPMPDDVERVADWMKVSAGFSSSVLGKVSGELSDDDWRLLAEAAIEALPSPIPAGDISLKARLEAIVEAIEDCDEAEAIAIAREALSLISLGEGGEGTDLRALSGSCPTGQAATRLDASRCDPGQEGGR